MTPAPLAAADAAQPAVAAEPGAAEPGRVRLDDALARLMFSAPLADADDDAADAPRSTAEVLQDWADSLEQGARRAQDGVEGAVRGAGAIGGMLVGLTIGGSVGAIFGPLGWVIGAPIGLGIGAAGGAIAAQNAMDGAKHDLQSFADDLTDVVNDGLDRLEAARAAEARGTAKPPQTFPRLPYVDDLRELPRIEDLPELPRIEDLPTLPGSRELAGLPVPAVRGLPALPPLVKARR